MIPLHTWLPDTYPLGAYRRGLVFLSVYTTKAAVYLLARAQPSTELVAFMGAVMAVYGVTFLVVFQTEHEETFPPTTSFRRYHGRRCRTGKVGPGIAPQIAQLALDGAMAHVFNHILYKALLFMTVGVIIWKTGENTLDKLGGLMRKMPVTAIAFWIAAFSISGVPLFNGFVSKGMVVTAAQQTNTLLFVLLEIASFGTFLSFLKLDFRSSASEQSKPATHPC